MEDTAVALRYGSSWSGTDEATGLRCAHSMGGLSYRDDTEPISSDAGVSEIDGLEASVIERTASGLVGYRYRLSSQRYGESPEIFIYR